jgi:D-alanyl-D-alanine carboxypeptidase
VTFWSVALVLLPAAIVTAALSRGDSERAPRAPRSTPEPATPIAERAAPRPERELVLVRRRNGLPPSWIRRLRRSRAVDALAEGSRTQWLLRRSTTAAGAVVDASPPGYAVPLDTYVVDPRAYARVTRNPAFRRLRGRRVLLSASSAGLRRLRRGDRMTLADGRTLTIAGVIPDHVARDAEVVAAAADVPRAERRQVAAVVATRDPSAVADAVPDDRLTRVAILEPRPSIAGRGIIRPVAVKRRFGEFAVRLPFGDDWIGIDPRWLRRTIVTRNVPILGPVTCHRALIAPLRRALGRLERRGLARLVDRGDYAGCYAPRRIPASGSLSLHAWGLAVDLNASENPQGSEPQQDPRLVRAFEREGFTWGGHWPTAPDGMHFELHDDRPR